MDAPDPWFLPTNTQWLIVIPGIETCPNQKGKGAYPQRKNYLKMILPEDVRKSVTPTV
jgi:hypothetical protein